MRLKLLLRIILTILVIIVVIIGGLFGLNAYSDQHPNNRSINDWNKLNPLAPVVSEKSHTITSYKEVKQSDIPTKAKEKL